jgi:hypothetical protein
LFCFAIFVDGFSPNCLSTFDWIDWESRKSVVSDKQLRVNDNNNESKKQETPQLHKQQRQYYM